MERRTFLTSILGTAALTGVGASAAHGGQGSAQAATSSDFYVWRQYVLRNGTQMRRLVDFMQNAAIPALNRLGHKPVGVFEVVAGVPTPTLFVLTPVASLAIVRAGGGRARRRGRPGPGGRRPGRASSRRRRCTPTTRGRGR